MKKTILLSILGLTIASNSHADGLSIGLISSSGSDLISTELALMNNRQELNPLMSNRFARIGIKTVSVGTILVTRKELIKHNHRKAANIGTIIVIGIYSACVINNSMKMGKH